MQLLLRRRAILLITATVSAVLAVGSACAQQASTSAWDAADFRVWGYIPYWANATTINGLASSGMYTHVSDVLYFGAVRPDSNGNLPFATSAYQTNLATLRTLKNTHGFNLHLSVFEVVGGNTDATWRTIIADPARRATFVAAAKSLLQGGAGTADDLKGFNFDWERPATDQEWGDYTQLARELRAAINPLGMEVSVCDYGSTDSDWDDTALFDAKVYDQLMMMSYHLSASSSGTYANSKLALTGQGAAKAFSNDQVAIGFGSYGKGIDPDGTGGPLTAPPTYTHKDIVAAHPTLAYDALTLTEGDDSWTIESRKQIREKTQVALDRNMPGIFSWTLHYDATNNLGQHRVAHHYIVFKRGVPDLNLDGKVNATDANTLANNMGTVPGWKGTATAAQFENFYISGNWEKGDRDGNGFVNQLDADWLAGRYAALNVALPDRLAYSGTFEGLSNSKGLTGRWNAYRDAGKIRESGNYTQHAANFLTYSASGAGSNKFSNSAVTIRNQNGAENFDGLNTLPRIMQATLATPIDLGQSAETYFTFLVRSNTSPLSAGQLASNNRTLALEFQNSAGAVQFDFSLFANQQQFAINSVADSGGTDVLTSGFAPDATYLFVGKLSGNGAAGNTMQASLLPNGSVVGNFSDPSFPWMLTASSSTAYNPLITQLQFKSLYEGNFTISNLWLGTASAFFTPTATSMGDYNNNGLVDAADYLVWRSSMGQTGAGLVADGNGNNVIDAADYDLWRRNFGQIFSGAATIMNSSSTTAVPEPAAFALAAVGAIILLRARLRLR